MERERESCDLPLPPPSLLDATPPPPPSLLNWFSGENKGDEKGACEDCLKNHGRGEEENLIKW